MLPQLRTSSQLMDVLIYLQIVVLVSLRYKDIKEEEKTIKVVELTNLYWP